MDNSYASSDIDTSSDFDSIVETYTGSVATVLSGNFSFGHRNGRRFQAYREGAYLMPNDDEELRRLDLYHHIFYILLDGKLYLAPLKKDIKKILDLGTGNGNWAVDIAEEFPGARVYGYDLSRIQPPWVPANCSFDVDDIEDDWTLAVDDPDIGFDFIHARSLCGAIKNWKELLKRCFELPAPLEAFMHHSKDLKPPPNDSSNLVPGGYFEFHDYDCKLFSASGKDLTREASPLKKFWDLVVEGGTANGRSFLIAADIEDLMKEAGFEVEARVQNWPIGTWPTDERQKEIGTRTGEGLQDSFNTFINVLKTDLTSEQVQKWSNDIKEESEDKSLQLCTKGYFVFGRKPGVKVQSAAEGTQKNSTSKGVV